MNIQALSDQFKRLLGSRPSRAALAALTQLERLDWHPRALEDALAESPFTYSGETLQFDAASPVPLPQAIIQFVAHYHNLISPQDDLMGIQQAAAYVDLSVRTLKWYIHEKKLLTPRKVGHALVFTRAMLDDFNLQRQAVGKPRPLAPPPTAPQPSLRALLRQVQAHPDLSDYPDLARLLDVILD